ncbi:hypothetical protein YC2023_023917 [Brassica napus]|uniref:Uncharacterized protein n=1 Tax=Brassica campestris TaxID=3711 RepID=A0A3P6AVU6_BRACM|nr:unnamed protein product [Brassica rapa]
MLDLVELLSQCSKLQKLWLYVSQVMDLIEHKGLKVVASCCVRNCEKKKRNCEIKGLALREQGLVSVSESCPNLESVIYFSVQFTKAALVTTSV